MLHGFDSGAKLRRYLKCLENIKVTSEITISITNHILGIPMCDCFVAFIDRSCSTYYGGGLVLDRQIILAGGKLSSFGGDPLGAFNDRVIQGVFGSLAGKSSSYNYRLVSVDTLVAKIRNPAPAPGKALAAPNFAPLKPSLNYNIRYH
jgi:hypothetical protein